LSERAEIKARRLLCGAGYDQIGNPGFRSTDEDQNLRIIDYRPTDSPEEAKFLAKSILSIRTIRAKAEDYRRITHAQTFVRLGRAPRHRPPAARVRRWNPWNCTAKLQGSLAPANHV